jgi:multidrug efflux pump subunit AcrB
MLRLRFIVLAAALAASACVALLTYSAAAQTIRNQAPARTAGTDPATIEILNQQRELREIEREIDDRVQGLRHAQVKQTRLIVGGFAIVLILILALGAILWRRRTAAGTADRQPSTVLRVDFTALRNWEERRLLRKIARGQAELRLALQNLGAYVEETDARKDQFNELVEDARRRLERLGSEVAAAARR